MKSFCDGCDKDCGKWGPGDPPCAMGSGVTGPTGLPLSIESLNRAMRRKRLHKGHSKGNKSNKAGK